MLKKNAHLEKIRHNIALAHKHHIISLGFFMLGFPTETRAELKATIDFAVNQSCMPVIFSVTPFEGTELA